MCPDAVRARKDPARKTQRTERHNVNGFMDNLLWIVMGSDDDYFPGFFLPRGPRGCNCIARNVDGVAPNSSRNFLAKCDPPLKPTVAAMNSIGRGCGSRSRAVPRRIARMYARVD